MFRYSYLGMSRDAHVTLKVVQIWMVAGLGLGSAPGDFIRCGMVRRPASRTLLALAVLIGAAVAGAGGDPFEPNESIEGAVPIGPGVYEAEISPSGDADFYVVDLEETGSDSILVRVIFEHAAGDLDARIFAADSTLLDNSISNDDNEFLFEGPRPAFGSLRFIQIDGFQGATNSYRMEVEVLSNAGLPLVEDIFEPNDSFKQALPLTSVPSSSAALVMLDSRDDWFRFEAGAGDTFRATAEFIHKRGNIDLVLRDGDLEIVAFAATIQDIENLEAHFLEKGLCYLQVDVGRDSENLYELSWSLSPDTGERAWEWETQVIDITPGGPLLAPVRELGKHVLFKNSANILILNARTPVLPSSASSEGAGVVELWSLILKNYNKNFNKGVPKGFWQVAEYRRETVSSSSDRLEAEEQPHPEAFGVEDFWSLSRGRRPDGKPVVIAVIDTGAALDHPLIRDSLWVNQAELDGLEGVDDDGNGFVDDIHGYDFVSVPPEFAAPGEDVMPRDADPSDFDGHGHAVAAIAAASDLSVKLDARGLLPYSGVAPEAELMILRAGFRPPSGGLPFLATVDILDAMRYAIDNGADVVNMSFESSLPSPPLEALLIEAQERGIVVVAAAGNGGSAVPRFPAAYPQVIAVGSVGSSRARSGFSSYGAAVDLQGLGEAVLAPGLEADSAIRVSGTSFSSPQVAGAAALMLGQRDRSPDQVRRLLMAEADSVDTANTPFFAGQLGAGVPRLDFTGEQALIEDEGLLARAAWKNVGNSPLRLRGMIEGQEVVAFATPKLGTVTKVLPGEERLYDLGLLRRPLDPITVVRFQTDSPFNTSPFDFSSDLRETPPLLLVNYGTAPMDEIRPNPLLFSTPEDWFGAAAARTDFAGAWPPIGSGGLANFDRTNYNWKLSLNSGARELIELSWPLLPGLALGELYEVEVRWEPVPSGPEGDAGDFDYRLRVNSGDYSEARTRWSRLKGGQINLEAGERLDRIQFRPSVAMLATGLRPAFDFAAPGAAWNPIGGASLTPSGGAVEAIVTSVTVRPLRFEDFARSHQIVTATDGGAAAGWSSQAIPLTQGQVAVPVVAFDLGAEKSTIELADEALSGGSLVGPTFTLPVGGDVVRATFVVSLESRSGPPFDQLWPMIRLRVANLTHNSEERRVILPGRDFREFDPEANEITVDFFWRSRIIAGQESEPIAVRPIIDAVATPELGGLGANLHLKAFRLDIVQSETTE